MFFVVFFSVLFVVVVYILLRPVVLYINTITNQYYLQLKGLAKASIEGDKEELVRVRLKVLFLNFSFYPLRKSNSKETNSKREDVKKRRKKLGFRRGLRLLKTFRVKQFLLNVDTGNCVSNAKLYPLFIFLNYRTGGFNINFEGRNQLVLQMQNRPIYLIRSFINV